MPRIEYHVGFVDPETIHRSDNRGSVITGAGTFRRLILSAWSVSDSGRQFAGLKPTGRQHRFHADMADIMKLIEINNVDVEDESFTKMCLKFGNDDLYNQIVNGINKDE